MNRGWVVCHRITARSCNGVNYWMVARSSRNDASRIKKASRRFSSMVEKDKGKEEVDNEEEDDGKDMDND